MLTPDDALSIFETASLAAGDAELEVMVGDRRYALTRFANNTIHQNVSERSRYVSVRTAADQRTARVTINRLDRESVRRAVAEVLAIMRASEPDPELLPMAGPSPIQPVDHWCSSTALATPEIRAAAVRDAIHKVGSINQNAAGFYSTGESFDALLNSCGVTAHHNETMAQFSITSMASDSSGWAKASSVECGDLDPVTLARTAADKAARSAHPRELPAGDYTVVLEPAAVLDLVGQMFADFSGTALHDKRSFLSDRFGEVLFGSNITIDDDVYHPLQSGPAYGGEGLPRQRVRLVEAGRAARVVHSRLSAYRAKVEPTGHGFPLPNEHGEAPMNIVISGGDSTVDQMIASTKRGILVTRLWYIREVEPYEKLMTGMTRDGTFLIENGEITAGLRNFRFNQSIIDLLNNVETMSASVRASGEETFDMVVPAMKVRNFRFTEVTRF
jgi:predicted Zn-dependent protease